MRLFTCEACGQIAFFENTVCTRCGLAFVYDPERVRLRGLEAKGHELRRCSNFEAAGCNWGVDVTEAARDHTLCRSCRLTRTIPVLTDDAARLGWAKIERAKRRLLYTLFALRLPVSPLSEDPHGVAFEILLPQEGAPVTTGHAHGVVTLNVAEADDPFRERVRVDLNEPYRTLLGHLRHEIGHHYWERLVEPVPAALNAFRSLFGDERHPYDEALARHYEQGPPSDWNERHVSAYASMHPWEDWAETYAHYLHMVDTVDTARAYGMSLHPRPTGKAPATPGLAPAVPASDGFGALVNAWYPLTFALNSLNRSMGHPDWYPFILPPPALEKLRFVHQVLERRTEVA